MIVKRRGNSSHYLAFTFSFCWVLVDAFSCTLAKL
ncbi:hypothetical protein GKS24_00005 [Streptococcus uberis]|nr:hypothetical protein [Streptococcus uberis]MTB77027.1 hypothetical protein [Streptococcus uberis]